MTLQQTQILNDAQVRQILKRMAYQVYEQHFNEKELIIAGIEGRGFAFAGMLHEELAAVSKLKLSLIEVKLDKTGPTEHSVKLGDERIKAEGKNILLVDDVLNTGKTMMYALLPFVRAGARHIKTAVLVDRDHKSFPVSADFIGIALSTTLQEHITVSIERKKVNVFLS
jgi:pyrimidine operon attenuation protein/uracil phosphoribosyltransferase